MASVNNVPKDLQDAIREHLGRRTKLYIKRMVKQEIKQEKWENRVIAFSGTRLFVFNTKVSKSPQEHNICYLDIQSIESTQQNKLTVTTHDGKSYSFVTLEAETDEINHMITHVGTSVKQIFPSFPVERIIKQIEVHPPERLKMMNDMVKTIETKEHGPCGNFAMMYACMCDYFNLPYREEVAWDVDTIYLSQDCRVLFLKDFDHLNQKDLPPIVAALEHNTWFTGLDLSGIKTTNEVMTEVLKVMQKNCLIEDLNLSNTQMSSEFLTRLGTAVLSNTGSQLSKIDLSKNVVDDKAMVSFIGSLKNLSRGVTHLNISSTKLGKGFREIFRILSDNESIFSNLQVLNVSDNQPKEEDLQNMYNFLARQNGITHLDLSGIECALENLMGPLQMGCTSITHMYLSRNMFTHQKKKEVSVQPSWKRFFASNCSLEVIDLSQCKIPPDAIKELMLGIASNAHLKNLDLNISGNDLGFVGSQNIENTIGTISNLSRLDLSHNNLEQGMGTLLSWIKTNKTLKHLSIGRNFDFVKQKQLPAVLDGLVQLIQDEDCGLESLSLADSKLHKHLAVVINGLGSNMSLLELDISGNLMGDFGARMLSKALQINNKLRTLHLDKNGITASGFSDIADALEKNFSLKKMPTPVNDLVAAQQKNAEKTESAIQRIEALLQRNHSPQKYLANRDFKIQGCYLSSTQQMVDRLVVQVQDTVNALEITPSVEEYKQDIETANGFVKDANSSQLLLPRLQDIADKSVDEDSPVVKRLKELSVELKTVLDNQIKKTVEGMLECTTNQLTAITNDKEFSTELQSGSYKKSTLPDDFAAHSLTVIEMDILNKLSEVNLAVATNISDRVVDAVIENLSASHKKLTNHLNKEKSKAGRVSKISTNKVEEEKEKEDKQKSGSLEDLVSNKSSDSASSSPMPDQTKKKEELHHVHHDFHVFHKAPGTPNIANKRETVKNRKNRPPTVIEADHVLKALEVYNSVNPLESAPPKPCPGSRTNTPPSSSNVGALVTVHEADDSKKADKTDGKKVDQILDLSTAIDLDEEPPKVTINNATVSATAGKSVTLTCTVNSPVTEVCWKKNGSSSKISTTGKKYSGSTPENPSLTIESVEKGDAGTYTCYATNSGGTGQSSATLNVAAEVAKTTTPPKSSDAPLASLPNKEPPANLLQCAGKNRPRPNRTRRPGRPNPTISIVDTEKDAKDETEKMDQFFESFAAKVSSSAVTTPSPATKAKTETLPKETKAEKDKKLPRKPSQDGKTEGGLKSLFPFGKDKKETASKDQKEHKSKPFFSRFGKGKSKDEDKDKEKEKEEVKVENEPAVESKANSVPDKENTEPEEQKEAPKEVKVEVKEEPAEEKKEEVKEPKKALRPPMGGMGFGGDMLAQIKLKQQNRRSFGKSSEESKDKDKESNTNNKDALKPTPKPDTSVSPKPSQTTTAEKTPKSILQELNKPKPSPRTGNNRTSTGSRSSATGEDGESKAPKPAPAPKPRPNLMPKPRSSVKSDALESEGDKKSPAPGKSGSLPRSIPPITDKAENSIRPVSMFIKPNKDTSIGEKPLPSSKSSSDLSETTNNSLLNDSRKLVEDAEEDSVETKKDETENGEKEDDSKPNDEKKDSSENGSSKRSSDSLSADSNNIEEEKTEFENEVIMV